jgi:hypothetical protein
LPSERLPTPLHEQLERRRQSRPLGASRHCPLENLPTELVQRFGPPASKITQAPV